MDGMQRYAIRDVYKRVPMLCRFAEFTKQHGSTDLKSAAAQIESFASHWLAGHEPSGQTAEARSKIAEEARNPLRQMLQFALEGRVTADRKRKTFPFEDQAPEFLPYLREERGLRDATLYKYVHCLNGFGNFPKPLGVTSLTQLSPALLASFVIDTAPKLAWTGKRDLCGMTRVFLRFCHRQRVIANDLSNATDMPQVFPRRRTSINHVGRCAADAVCGGPANFPRTE
jgi:integrase/recombinase XerD